MISRETIGFYSDARGSQKYPALVSLFYPSRGNFIAFVGNDESGDLVRRAVRRFRESARFPSEGIAGPRLCRASVGRINGRFGRKGIRPS